MKLLTPGNANPKLAKGSEFSIESAILHLAPVDIALPGRSVCPDASVGCTDACLNTSGHGGMPAPLNPLSVSRELGEGSRLRVPNNTVQRARIRRTELFFQDRGMFLEELSREKINWSKVKRLKSSIKRNINIDAICKKTKQKRKSQR